MLVFGFQRRGYDVDRIYIRLGGSAIRSHESCPNGVSSRACADTVASRGRPRALLWEVALLRGLEDRSVVRACREAESRGEASERSQAEDGRCCGAACIERGVSAST